MRCGWNRLALGAWLLAAVMPVAWAQTGFINAAKDVPSCAYDCMATALTDSGCDLSDTKCICDFQKTETNTTVCVQKACPSRFVLIAKNVTDTACGYPVRNNSHTYYRLTIALYVLSGLCVFQRLIFKSQSVGLAADDWFILITLLVTGGSVFTILHMSIPNGIGRDIWTLSPHQLTEFFKGFLIMAALYFAEIATVKLSLLFFYLRIFPATRTRMLLWCTIGVNTAVGLCFVFAGIFYCTPIDYFWHQWDDRYHGTCHNPTATSTAHAIISIVIDIWMLAIPLFELRSLQLNGKKKIGIALMFTAGTFVTIVSILRLQAVVHFGKSQNVTRDWLLLVIWSTVEVNCGIICACMPSIRLLFVRMFPRAFGNGSKTAGTGSYSMGSDTRGSRSKKTTKTLSKSANYPNLPSDRIRVQTTYEVDFGDSDETSLVPMGVMRPQPAVPQLPMDR